MRNPADDWAWLTQVHDELRSLRADVADLQQQRGTYMQPATVSAFVSGPFCTVTFESGDTAVLGRLSTYATPVVGDAVAVLVSPFMSLVLGKLA